MSYHDYINCLCGGRLYLGWHNMDYICNTCKFRITTLDILTESSRSNIPQMMVRKYQKFKRAQFDPMNQLPAHYLERGS